MAAVVAEANAMPAMLLIRRLDFLTFMSPHRVCWCFPGDVAQDRDFLVLIIIIICKKNKTKLVRFFVACDSQN